MARKKLQKPNTKERLSNFTSGKSNYDVYKRGAFIGGTVGIIAGIIIGKKIILCGLGGALVGGYIAFKVKKEDNTFSLKKFKSSKTNTDTNLKTETNGK